MRHDDGLSYFPKCVIWIANFISKKLSRYFFVCISTSDITPLLILCIPLLSQLKERNLYGSYLIIFFVRYPGMKMQWECHHLSTFLFSLWMTTLWGKYIGPDHLSLKSNIIEKIQMVYTTFLKKYFRDHLEPKRTILLNCSMNI